MYCVRVMISYNPKDAEIHYLELFGTFVVKKAIIFISTQQITKYIPQHLFKSPSDHLCQENSSLVNLLIYRGGHFVIETRIEVLTEWFGVWE